MQRRIDPDSERPIYKQLADILRAKMETGEWAPGRELPSEARLGHEYEISQASVERALAVLRADGLIVRQRGRVAKVAERREPTIVHFEPGAQARIRFRHPTPTEQHELEVDETALVMEIDSDGRTRVVPVGPHVEIAIGDTETVRDDGLQD